MVIGTWRLMSRTSEIGPKMKNGRRRSKADTHRTALRRAERPAQAEMPKHDSVRKRFVCNPDA